MIALAVAFPLAGALVAALFRDRDARRIIRIILAATAAFIPFALAGRVDGLSLVFATIVSILGLLATVYSTDIFSVSWIGGDVFWSRKSVYFVLLGAFWSSMLLVVLAQGFGTLWFGIAATTLATAFLVGFSGEDAALEAAWKYLVLCSVGIGIALIGIVLLASATLRAGVTPEFALSWEAMSRLHAPPNGVVHLATALMVIGFATKAGLFPLHSWLPDAHSKAPAPVSGLLSGVLVSCALYGIIRTLQAAGAWHDAATLHVLLTWFGACSIAAAGMLMLVQRDLKRMFAYSTVEHAGIVVFALGVGGRLGTAAALLHLVAHAFTKSGAFFVAGITQREIAASGVHGGSLWTTTAGGRLLLLSLGALGGLPPFGLFVSEFLVALAAIEAHAWAPLIVAALGAVVAFGALIRTGLQVNPTANGDATRTVAATSDGVSMRLSIASACVALALAAATAAIPWTTLGTVLMSVSAEIQR
jgi:hydrogenase-4 component F